MRFRTPDDGVSTFTDAIRGEVTVEWRLIRDFVIQRADGTPIFFLANAVDDIDMGITHVIRGEDLLDSTHRVLALRAALGGGDASGVRAPALIVDAATRAKLSKRHGVIALEEFRKEGYLPEALTNYLALQGWAPAGAESGDEILSASELFAAFDLDHVTHAAAAFDRKKLDWMNGEWIRRLPLDELVARVEPLARERFGDRYDRELGGGCDRARTRTCGDAQRDRRRNGIPVRRRRRLRDCTGVVGEGGGDRPGRRAARRGDRARQRVRVDPRRASISGPPSRRSA